MAFHSSEILYIVELIAYLFLLPLNFYLARRHGSRGLLGFGYLKLYCAVRIAGDVVLMLPANNKPTSQPNLTTAILSSIGLSPLTLALSGFLHEVHSYLIHATTSRAKVKQIKTWLWLAQLQIHIVSITGMVLVVIGSAKLASNANLLTPSEAQNDEKLRSAGTILLLFLWFTLTQYAVYLLYCTRRARIHLQKSIMNLIYYTTAASPFVGIRTVYAVIYTFDRTDSALNPVSGATWVKVILVVLVPLGAVVAMSVGGFLSREIQTESEKNIYADAEVVAYEKIREKAVREVHC